ncbi:MAG: Nif11-like leader peptide family natural product precursor [Bacilli bacterium]|nr:Nif11-like leader peptide family natural product precursor [Bacilli bacterium]
MKDELLNGLSKEQIERVKACKSQDEALKLAREEGIELTSEQLEAVRGGCLSVTGDDGTIKQILPK